MDDMQIRVLMIDDDSDDYDLTRDLLAEIPGHNIVLEWAANFDAGRKSLARCEHDAYLLDYWLGMGNGLDLLREALRWGCRAPIIFVTGQGDRDLGLQALQDGAADFLVKGKFDAAALERAIRYSLQQKRHADELEWKVADRTAELERANAELRASEERYRLVVEGATGFAIMMLDLEGRVTTWNIGAERLLGYAEAEVVGQHISRFFTPEDLAAGKPETELRRARDTESGDDDNWLVRKDGSRFWASGATTALRDDAGNLRSFAKIVRDVSERKQKVESEAHLAAIVTSSKDAIIGMNLDGGITSWNQGAEYIYQYTAEEAIGQPVTLLIPEDLLDEKPKLLDRIRRGEVIEHYETVRRRKDGSLIDISLTVSPIRDTSGRIIGVSKVARDITEHVLAEKRLRESEERFRMLADNISQLAWTCDTLGNVTWYNQRWLDYTGLSFGEMKGWGWSKVQHPDHLERVVQRIQRSAETGAPWDDTFPLRGKDGVYRWFLSRAVPIRDAEGKVVLWFGTNTDITEQREMADELRRNAAEMSEADRRKNEFLAMLAHELRNPLAPIRNAVQIMKRSSRPVASGEEGESASDVTTLYSPLTSQLSTLDMLERQVDQMVRLVDDLLDVSRISRGKIELKRGRVELQSIVNHAVEAARPHCESSGLELIVTLPPRPIYLNADSTRLAQVIGNLLNNACKFTDAGGRIELIVSVESPVVSEELKASNATLAARPSPVATIRVRDTGIGIAPDQLSSIFDMFVQIDTSLERSVGGLGIGLTLVKSLMEMHGGAVEAHSAGIGHGSEFVVRMPLESHESRVAGGEPVDSSSLNPHPSPLTTPSPSPCRILVVDDNRDSATTLAMLLKLTGNETRTAHDGPEAVDAAEAFRPDVVLLDIGLPKLNGYEVCRHIRQQPWSNGMLLVALTGWGQEEDRQKSKIAGFDAHMVKPVDRAALAKLLAELPRAKERQL